MKRSLLSVLLLTFLFSSRGYCSDQKTNEVKIHVEVLNKDSSQRLPPKTITLKKDPGDNSFAFREAQEMAADFLGIKTRELICFDPDSSGNLKCYTYAVLFAKQLYKI